MSYTLTTTADGGLWGLRDDLSLEAPIIPDAWTETTNSYDLTEDGFYIGIDRIDDDDHWHGVTWIHMLGGKAVNVSDNVATFTCYARILVRCCKRSASKT